MGIKVLKKDDGFWLSFDSSKGKHALVHISRLCVDNGSIITKAILETCAECTSDALVENSNSAAGQSGKISLPCGEHNTSKAEILLTKEKLVNLMVDWVKCDNGQRYRTVSECVAELSAVC